MLRYMLDTHIVSYYLRRVSPALEERVNTGLRERTIAISAITRAELRYGQMGLAPSGMKASRIWLWQRKSTQLSICQTHNNSLQADGPDGPRPELECWATLVEPLQRSFFGR